MKSLFLHITKKVHKEYDFKKITSIKLYGLKLTRQLLTIIIVLWLLGLMLTHLLGMFFEETSMKICIAIVRHGDYVGDGGHQDPLSELGRNQMQSVREVITEHLRDIYGTNRDDETNVKRLAISFSSTKRALESTVALKHHEDMIVTELYLTERREIPAPEKIVRKVLALLAYHGANVATIVAHGDMPAVFAETLIKIAGGEAKSLRSPAKGDGFLVNMATGEVILLSPKKPKEEVKQPPSVRQSASRTTAQQGKPVSPATPYDVTDYDIPF